MSRPERTLDLKGPQRGPLPKQMVFWRRKRFHAAFWCFVGVAVGLGVEFHDILPFFQALGAAGDDTSVDSQVVGVFLPWGRSSQTESQVRRPSFRFFLLFLPLRGLCR